MFENIIIIPPNHTYGDILSIIGLFHFLTDYYKNVFLYIEDVSESNYIRKIIYLNINTLFVY